MSVDFKFGVTSPSWRQVLDRISREAGARLIAIQSELYPEKCQLLIVNPETDNNLRVQFNAFSFAENELLADIQKKITEDNAISTTRRVSVKAGLLAEKATILANMAKTLSELSLELDALAERKKQ